MRERKFSKSEFFKGKKENFGDIQNSLQWTKKQLEATI